MTSPTSSPCHHPLRSSSHLSNGNHHHHHHHRGSIDSVFVDLDLSGSGTEFGAGGGGLSASLAGDSTGGVVDLRALAKDRQKKDNHNMSKHRKRTFLSSCMSTTIFLGHLLVPCSHLRRDNRQSVYRVCPVCLVLECFDFVCWPERERSNSCWSLSKGKTTKQICWSLGYVKSPHLHRLIKIRIFVNQLAMGGQHSYLSDCCSSSELSNHGWLLRETTVGFPLNVTSFTLTDLWGFTMPSLV
jgi:hypothetical protein